MNKLNKILSYVIVALLSSALTLALLPTRGIAPVNAGSSSGSEKLQELADYIDEYFVDEVDMTELEDAAASAMVAATGDRWSYYVPADEYASLVESSQNSYVGVGITITMAEDESGLEVVEVAEGGPADMAGVQVHDILILVEGQNCAELGVDEARNLVRGAAGTDVKMTFKRDGKEIELSITRKAVEVPVATYQMLDSGYGLIEILNFNQRCAQETIEAIMEVMASGAKGIIFDVRFNPGGSVAELIALLDYILPEGPLFRSESYDGRTSVDESDATHIDIPMVVLVNGDSYSAAEFFAAALREYDYAQIVGQQTSGKGHYQQTFRLSDGSAVAISTGKYYTPNGVSLEGVGITPDVIADVDEETYKAIYFGDLSVEEDPQIQAAISALNSMVQP